MLIGDGGLGWLEDLAVVWACGSWWMSIPSWTSAVGVPSWTSAVGVPFEETGCVGFVVGVMMVFGGTACSRVVGWWFVG